MIRGYDIVSLLYIKSNSPQITRSPRHISHIIQRTAYQYDKTSNTVPHQLPVDWNVLQNEAPLTLAFLPGHTSCSAGNCEEAD